MGVSSSFRCTAWNGETRRRRGEGRTVMASSGHEGSVESPSAVTRAVVVGEVGTQAQDVVLSA